MKQNLLKYPFREVTKYPQTCVHVPRHLNVLREALLLKVPDGKLVRVRQEMLDASLRAVILQMVHQMGSVALDLFAARYRAEHNLGEALRGERPEADAPDRAAVLD